MNKPLCKIGKNPKKLHHHPGPKPEESREEIKQVGIVIDHQKGHGLKRKKGHVSVCRHLRFNQRFTV